MRILKATTTDGKTEIFALDHILNITPQGDTVKILMGAGLYWRVKADSITISDIGYVELQYMLRGKNK